MNVMWCRGCKLYYWTKANKVYFQLITNNKRLNVWQNISQRKSRFYTKIMVFLKLSLLHVHLRGDAMALQQLFTYMVSICEKCVFNMSMYIFLLFNFNNFCYYTFGSLIEDYLQCHKIQNNFLLRLRWFNSRKDFLQCHTNLTNFALRLI